MSKDKLAKVETFVALAPGNLVDSPFSQEELTGSMGVEGFSPQDLEKIKVPAGGATVWEIEATGEAEKSLDCIIIDAQDIRMFYEDGYNGESNPPDCMSLDLKTGVVGEDCPEEVTGNCATCPKSKWGSAVNDKGEPTAGQACKQRKVMLLVRPGDSLPFVLNAPSSSLKYIKKHFGRCVSAHGAPFWGVVSSLKLRKETKGVEHSVIDPEILRPLDIEEVEAVRALRERFNVDSQRDSIQADAE